MGSFLFFAFSWWSIALRIVAIVHFIRRRPDFFWIWVILFHWVGALVYIVVEVIPDAGLLRSSFQVFPRRRRIQELERAIEEIEAALKGLLKPEFEEAQLGTAEIREVFRVPKVGNVAGSLVRSGTITRGSKARLVRDGVVISDNLTVDSLRRFKEDATEVREGYECGIGVGYSDIRIADVIETFEMREKPRA